MPSRSYRLYALDGRAGINLADWIKAESDEAAIEIARRIEHGAHKVEIWLRNRLVAVLSHPDDPAIQNACARRLFALAEKRRRSGSPVSENPV